MKKILLILLSLCLLFEGCSESGNTTTQSIMSDSLSTTYKDIYSLTKHASEIQIKEISSFEELINQLDTISLPAIFRVPEVYEFKNILYKTENQNQIFWGYPYKKIALDSNLTGIIFILIGDVQAPQLGIFDNNGVLKGTNALHGKGCNDYDVYCTSFTVINKDLTINRIDSTVQWKVENGKKIAGSEQIITEAHFFQIDKQGFIHPIKD